MKITASKDFYKSFSKYDKKLQQQINKAVEKLPDGDVKKLKGKNNDFIYRLRVRDVRVVFIMNSESIHIIDVDNRGDIYKTN
ncbi:MAG: type II toxin-antitoxin system RelE/ParE family toxin [Cyanobacteriota bacterium]